MLKKPKARAIPPNELIAEVLEYYDEDCWVSVGYVAAETFIKARHIAEMDYRGRRIKLKVVRTAHPSIHSKDIY